MPQHHDPSRPAAPGHRRGDRRRRAPVRPQGERRPGRLRVPPRTPSKSPCEGSPTPRPNSSGPSLLAGSPARTSPHCAACAPRAARRGEPRVRAGHRRPVRTNAPTCPNGATCSAASRRRSVPPRSRRVGVRRPSRRMADERHTIRTSTSAIPAGPRGLTTHAAGGLTPRRRAGDDDLGARGGGGGPTTEPATGVEVAIDALDIDAVRPFWKAVLGYEDARPPTADRARRSAAGRTDALVPADGRAAPAAQPHPRRRHRAPRRRRAAGRRRARGGRSAGQRRCARACWVLADAEGNEACVCTWQDRGRARPKRTRCAS